MINSALVDDGAADDEAARQEILERLDITHFVEAGAGTGKTTALVGRVVALVTSGEAKLGRIAAITFTEAAAAELRDRIHEALEEVAAGTEDLEQSVRARAALDEIDSAPISTLHGFAQRILAAHPFEAGLPPTFEVLDEGRSAVAFDDRWDGFVDRILDDPSLESALTRALVCGIELRHLRSVAEQFNGNWDLLVDVESVPEALSPIKADAVLRPLEAARAATEHCSTADDLLLAHIEGLAEFSRALHEASSELHVLQLLKSSPPLRSRKGQKGNWSCPIEDVRDLLEAAESNRLALIDDVVSTALSHLLPALADLTLAGAHQRRREGRLEFHDLLVQARELVRHNTEVRVALHDELERLLIDEFQDTDPIQAELAVRIANGSADPAAGAVPWTQLTVPPGRLFFVGDPKQAIYRFRRADMALFLDVRHRYREHRLGLTVSYRSVPGIIDWVNTVFSTLIGAGDAGVQPAYEALIARRLPQTGPIGELAPVVLLGGAVETLSRQRPPTIGSIRADEARDVVAAIRRIGDEGWPVGDEGRPATLADITVLIPTRTGLPILQEAFESHGVPYRLESSSLVYDTIEIHELMTVLRAIDDPTDQVSITAALRSPSFGCGDDDLLSYRRAHGSWDYRQKPPEALGASHPVVVAMSGMAELHAQRWWTDVSGLVELVIRDRKLLELALGERRPRDAWRRLRFVADQARQFTDGFGGDLRHYLAWVELQRRDDVRAVEVVLPESDDDAVRVMTMHGAKGLEFPVVILTGLNRTASRSSDPTVLWGPDGPEVKLSKNLKTKGYTALAEREAVMNRAQDLRLLYVAATRARDHLVVCLHHSANSKSCHAVDLLPLCAAAPDLCRTLDPALQPELGPQPEPSSSSDGFDPTHAGGLSLAGGQAPVVANDVAPSVDADMSERAAWEEQRALLVGPGALPRSIAATTVAALARDHADVHNASAGGSGPPDDDGLLDNRPDLDPTDPSFADDGTDEDLPPWRRGRAGTSIGRAVHAVLQTIDLETGAHLEALSRIQAVAEGVSTRERDIVVRVRSALDSEIVKDAVAGGRFWRELYVGAPVGDHTLEGFIDLLVEGPDGYTVVDYKTDAVATEGDLDRALHRYRLQGAAYALAVQQALGVTVTRCVFLFLRADGAVAKEVDRLGDALAEVEALLTETNDP